MSGTPKTVTELYPNVWLRAIDLERPVTVKIIAAEIEALRLPSGETRQALVLSFEHATKRLATNKTQCKAIAEIVGSEAFADWVGKRVVLGPGTAPNGKATVKISSVGETS